MSNARLTVQLDGQTHHIAVQPDESLLDAMLRQGVPAPHACGMGECATCMCQLVAGQVHRLADSTLDDADVAAGRLLVCRARAASEALSVEFF